MSRSPTAAAAVMNQPPRFKTAVALAMGRAVGPTSRQFPCSSATNTARSSSTHPTNALIEQLHQLADEAIDGLLIYYAGHGLLGSEQTLYLGLHRVLLTAAVRA